MNKTISINIGGFVFNIEEDAYQKLFHYLSTIKKNFTEAEERDEIMNDIEARIAEIFQSKLSVAKEVITDKDVDQVIEVMGKPEDYVSEEFADSADKKSTEKENASEQSSHRRFYRDTEDATLGGVCSGLAHYFNIDVAIIRILFVVFAIIGGTAIVAYIIMLIAVPEAKTTNEKLQMKGQSINVESIKEHFNRAKNNIKENVNNGKFKNRFNETVNKGVRAGSDVVKVFSKIFAFGLVAFGCFALIILTIVLFGQSGFLPIVGGEHVENLPTLLDLLYPGETQGTLVFIALIFATMIPIFGMIVTGTKILFNIKKSLRTVSISSTVLWLICVGILVVTGINLGMNMRNQKSVEYAIPFSDSTNVLKIDVSEDTQFSDHISYADVWNYSELVRVENENIILGYPRLVITQKADTGLFEIIVYKESNGLSTKDAINKAERIDYKISLSENRLLLPPYFSVPKSDKLRGQCPVVEIKVPNGKRIELGKNIDRIQVSVSGRQNYGIESFSNTTWISEGKNLYCIVDGFVLKGTTDPIFIDNEDFDDFE